MKEFKFCGEMTEYVEIPVTVFETQKELLEQISGVIRDAKDLGMSEEESMYIIYKDGSKYFIYDEEEIGKFKRYGIKAAVYEHVNGYEVYGDFAVTDNGDISIEESDIEEYGVYAGQYDVKEQDEQEVQETVEQTTEVETETAETAEQETVEGISEMETTTETDDSGFEYYSVEPAEVNKEVKEQFKKQKTSFKFYDVGIAYQVERYVNCGSLKYVQLGTYSDYAKAVRAAQEAIEDWGEENIYFHTVEIAKRNSKTAKDKYDREILKSEKKEIGYYWYASRLTDSKECVHISIDSPIRIPIETAQKSEIKEVKETVMTDKEAYEIIGNRAKELIQNVEVQQKMVEIAKTKSKDEAEK